MFDISKATNFVAAQFFKAKNLATEFSPEILTVLGVGSMIAGGIMACKATTKLEKVTEENVDLIERVNDSFEEIKDEKKYKRELAIAKCKVVGSYVKLYGPSVAVAAAGAGSVFAGNRVLRKRCGALAATVTAIQTSYDNYRERVRVEEGEEADLKYLYGYKEEKVGECVQMHEDGTETKEDIFEKKFDVNTKDWKTAFWGPDYSDKAEYGMDWYNINFLKNAVKELNRLLQIRRKMTLNEVKRFIGLPETDEGLIMGWDIDSTDSRAQHYIDIGLDANGMPAEMWREGKEDTVLLRFNCDPEPLYGAFSRSKEVNYVGC